MDRYPEHRFSATQAQQFKWLEQLYPSLFERIKGKVAEGSFQPLGATWVEMDTNMPSGEALVRQFLYGQRYYESRFGFRSQTFVLPDTCEHTLSMLVGEAEQKLDTRASCRKFADCRGHTISSLRNCHGMRREHAPGSDANRR